MMLGFGLTIEHLWPIGIYMKRSRVDPQMVSMYFYSFLKVKAISDVYFPLHSKLIDKILIRFGLDMHVYLFFKHVGSLI
jgi:hypothetical protein